MNAFNFLAPKRQKKPRYNGITMVLDKGMGFHTAEDLMKICGDYVDLLKFGWGTIAIHNRQLIKEKIAMYQEYDVDPYPGGTLFEIALKNEKLPEYFDEADKLGFKTVEISDGSTTIDPAEKSKIIAEAKERGFKVISEVGKKDPSEDLKLRLKDRVNLIKMDLDAGADKVLVEARESGQNIGMFDNEGKVKVEKVNYLIKSIPVDKLIWEAPKKNQQIHFILKVGSNVNLGNIAPEEITALETLRLGLRGDTLGKVNL
ncbi:MAG: phosphosulfolactate synthase [Euryarchaeota archaeon]|nr:phosphosulfolactate synthase [Euryarchaeota archaeon]MBU4607899.1 phosphosulfolactate synthase [Euryarchaeota archaeon]MBV1754429.1 phosphosulfolactate synthase [Methanobacterium sp.]MBV1767683.1 phosphosulfolactate synthase [Methanobacterium sp.]